jgi:tetratricopeptide (TPR) repeat protein
VLVGKWQLLLFGLMCVVIVYFSIPSKEQVGDLYYRSYLYKKAYQVFNSYYQQGTTRLTSLKHLRDIHLIYGRTGDAITVQKRLLALRPRNRQYQERLIELYQWSNQPFEQLKFKEAQLAQMTGAEHEQMLNQLGNDYRWLQRFKDADRIFAQLQKSNNLSYLFNILNYYMATQQEKKSHQLLIRLEMINQLPDNLREVLAHLLYLKKEYRKSARHYRILYNREVATTTKQKGGANLASFLKGGEHFLLRSRYFYRLVEIYQLLGEYGTILEMYQHLITYFPSKLSFRFEMVDYLISWQMEERATLLLNSIEEIVNQDPSRYTKELKRLGELYSTLSKDQRALEIYYQLLDLLPQR